MKQCLKLMMMLVITGLGTIPFTNAQETTNSETTNFEINNFETTHIDISKTPQRVLYINSYEKGHASSDEIEAAIRENFQGLFVVVDTFYMNAKNHHGKEAIEFKVNQIFDMIETKQPDLIIASDDEAVQHVVAPHLIDFEIPVVFCGVDWSAEKYGLPAEKVTGILEVEPIDQLIDTFREHHYTIRTVTVITDQSEVEKQNQVFIKEFLNNLNVETTHKMVENLDEWKVAFVEANEQTDAVYLPTNGIIKDWNTGAVHEFVKEQIKKPVFTCDEFMMAYSVFGLTKIPAEQGEWAAKTGARLMRGASPSLVEVAKNYRTKPYFNPIIAERLGFEPKLELKDQCEIVTRHP